MFWSVPAFVGVAAALALLKQKKVVSMIDCGDRLEPEIAERVKSGSANLTFGTLAATVSPFFQPSIVSPVALQNQHAAEQIFAFTEKSRVFDPGPKMEDPFQI